MDRTNGQANGSSVIAVRDEEFPRVCYIGKIHGALLPGTQGPQLGIFGGTEPPFEGQPALDKDLLPQIFIQNTDRTKNSFSKVT
jgi:hypothetical protein